MNISSWMEYLWSSPKFAILLHGPSKEAVYVRRCLCHDHILYSLIFVF